MAWVTPRTWASELITVDMLNEQIRDNMEFLKDPFGGVSYVSARNYALDASGSWSNVDTGDVNGHFYRAFICTDDSTVLVRVAAQLQLGNNQAQIGFGVSVNGTQYFPASGIARMGGGNVTNISAAILPVNFQALLTGISAGTNIFRLTWFGTHTVTTLLATAGNMAMFSVKEMP